MQLSDWILAVTVFCTVVNVFVCGITYFMLNTCRDIARWWEKECRRMDMESTNMKW